MRLPSRARFDIGVSRFAVLAFALAVVAVGAGCEDKHVGRPCDLGISPDGGTGSVATITSPALQCPSRICLLPGAEKDPGRTGSLCTASCESNSDCEDGELGDKASTSDTRCKNGFVCMVPTTVGNFCCQRFCVCRDFTNDMGTSPTPEVCKAPSTCVNVR